ncbi:UNVERIFIED_CONTAM: hypothetical protein GTU68_055066 [Idotea baltica]|nr:hypothetical protein [Idotea baltica]
MGLLTDPGVEKSMIPAFLFSYHRLLAVLFYVIGIVWFLGLAHNSLNHGTYFSENALLPGLVQGEFMGDSSSPRSFMALETEAEKYPNGVPYAWLLAQFTQIGLDTHSHNFTLEYPMGNKVFKGRNIYGILRAVRGSSTESLVVSAPYRPPSSLHQGTSASIALMIALAQFFSEQVYWAKDIIFLVTEHEQLGAQAWLEAYHRSSCGSGCWKAGIYPARAGPIQAAVNLEIGSSSLSHLDVKSRPQRTAAQPRPRQPHPQTLPQGGTSTTPSRIMTTTLTPRRSMVAVHQLKTLVAMIATQATGIPNGNHGLFHRFGIASVTLEGVRQDGRTWRSSNLRQVGRVLEGICRSLNNLLERFHQSFFFYLLPATNRYISIGE